MKTETGIRPVIITAVEELAVIVIVIIIVVVAIESAEGHLRKMKLRQRSPSLQRHHPS